MPLTDSSLIIKGSWVERTGGPQEAQGDECLCSRGNHHHSASMLHHQTYPQAHLGTWQTEFSSWQNLFIHSSSSGQDSHNLEVPGWSWDTSSCRIHLPESRYSTPNVSLSIEGHYHPPVAHARNKLDVLLDSSLSHPSLQVHSPSTTASWFQLLNLF